MKKHKRFSNYTTSLVGNARLLRRKMTDAEIKLWNLLKGKQMQLHFRRQIPFHQYILDFYCPKANLVIEVDGGQHYTKSGIIRDQRRDSYLKQNGLKVLRFSDQDVLMNISGVRQKIYEEIESILKLDTNTIETPPHSSPKRGGGKGDASSLGFTMLELMIILFILGILMAISIPSFSSWFPEYRLKCAVRELYSNMQFAKMRAIRAHETYRLTFDYTGNSYTLQKPDASIKKNINFLNYDPYGNVGYGKGSATKSANTSGGPIPSDFISFQSNRASFNSRGTGSNGYVYLANNKGTAYAVGIWSAGFIVIKKWNNITRTWE